MLGFLPPLLRMLLTLSLGIINTILHGSVTLLPLPFKWLAPRSALTDRVTRFCLRSTENWSAINGWLIRKLLPPRLISSCISTPNSMRDHRIRIRRPIC